jgi:hypothetical protein
LTEQEIDLTYIISEIQDIQGSLTQGEEGAKAILERLEGIEARLKEIETRFNAMRPEHRGEPIGGYVFVQD